MSASAFVRLVLWHDLGRRSSSSASRAGIGTVRPLVSASLAAVMLVVVLRQFGRSLNLRLQWLTGCCSARSTRRSVPLFRLAARHLPAGYLAVINATVPLLTVCSCGPQRTPPSLSKRVGVVVGLVGVGVCPLWQRRRRCRRARRHRTGLHAAAPPHSARCGPPSPRRFRRSCWRREPAWCRRGDCPARPAAAGVPARSRRDRRCSCSDSSAPGSPMQYFRLLNDIGSERGDHHLPRAGIRGLGCCPRRTPELRRRRRRLSCYRRRPRAQVLPGGGRWPCKSGPTMALIARSLVGQAARRP